MGRFRTLLVALGTLAAVFSVFVASVLVRFGSTGQIPEIGIRAGVSLLLCMTGLGVGAMRPELRATRSAALALFLTGVLWLRNSIQPYLSALSGTDAWLFYFFDVAYPLHLVFGLRFFVEFPPGAPPSRALAVMRGVNDVAGVGLLVLAKIAELRPFLGFGSLGPIDVVLANRSFYTGSALLAILVAGVRNYRRTTDADGRRRVRWIILGTVIALGPEMLNKFAKALGHELPLEMFTVLAVAVLPVTFAYAVVKHHVLDIQVVVHRSLQYLFARNVLKVIAAIPAFTLLVDLVIDPNRTVRQVFFDGWLPLVLLGLAVLALRFQGRLSRAVDRLFLREAVSPEELLERLLGQLDARETDIPRAVSHELEAAFHPNSCEVLLGDALPDELRARLERAVEPVEHDGVLAIPVRSARDTLSAAIVLGRKLSGDAYAPGDRRLLRAIGTQVGYALEAAALRQRILEEQRLSRAALARLAPMMECPTCGLCVDDGAEICPEDGARLELGLPVDRTLGGKYRLERRIGSGGMGVVYKAEDVGLGRSVAIKVIAGGRLGDGATLRRFEREGRVMARLAHPGIVAVHDFGRIGAQIAYLAMELLEGHTLRDELERHPGGVDPPTVAAWFGQVLDALTAAHGAGIIHRDLKPENTFVTRRGSLKVLDFGLARLVQPGGPQETQSGVLMGTVGYVSPEQLLGKEADARSDLFALAVMVFEAVCGKLPFPGVNVAQMATSLFTDDPHLPGDAPEIRALDRVLSRALAREPEKRFATAGALREALIPALAGCPSLSD